MKKIILVGFIFFGLNVFCVNEAKATSGLCGPAGSKDRISSSTNPNYSYAYTMSEYRGEFCLNAEPSPLPKIPEIGEEKTWTCYDANGQNPQPCYAKRNSNVEFRCTEAVPDNSTPCSNDSTGLTANVAKHLVSACSANNNNNADRCEYICKTGYHKVGNSCVIEQTDDVDDIDNTDNIDNENKNIGNSNVRCGTASGKVYEATSESFGSDTLCSNGIASPLTPAFPKQGETVEWRCTQSGNWIADVFLFREVVSCSAGRKSANTNIASGCGTASGNYSQTTTAFRSTNFCAEGFKLSSGTPIFPTTESSIDWVCKPNWFNNIFTSMDEVVCSATLSSSSSSIIAKPTLNLTISPITIDKTITLTWTISDGTPTKCTATGDWSDSKSIYSSNETITLSNSTNADIIKTYNLECINAGGSSGIKTVTVKVSPTPNNIPIASIITPTSGLDITAGQLVIFTGEGIDTDPGDTINGYQWRNNNCTMGTIMNSTASFSNTFPTVGTYTIYFRVMDNHNTWSACQSRTITVTKPIVDTYSKCKMDYLMYFGWSWENGKSSSYKDINNLDYSKISSSPMNSYTPELAGTPWVKKPLPSEEELNKIITEQEKANKFFWPRIYMVRLAQGDGIKGLDLWDEKGHLTNFENLFRSSLQLAKATGAPGIILDPEMYGNNEDNWIEEIVTLNNDYNADRVITRCKEIGAKLADITNTEYPNAVIWSLFLDWDSATKNSAFDSIAPIPAKYSGRKNHNYDRTIFYIQEGILERAKSKGYNLKVVDGGDASVWKVHASLQDIKDHLRSQEESLAEYKVKYPNFEFGAPISLWQDYEEDVYMYSNTLFNNNNFYENICEATPFSFWKNGCPWLNAIETNKIRNNFTTKKIQNFEEVLRYIFENRKYVWFYAPTVYQNSFDESDLNRAKPYRDVIKKAIELCH